MISDYFMVDRWGMIVEFWTLPWGEQPTWMTTLIIIQAIWWVRTITKGKSYD